MFNRDFGGIMSKFHYAGRYNGDPESLITHEHEPDHVPFKEAEDMNRFALIINGLSVVIAAALLFIYYRLSGSSLDIWGMILSIVLTIPHEFLHALCFEGDVYMYENIRKGMLFVTGPGTFSKAGFIFMCMLPNIVFGFIPFMIFLIDPSQKLLGTLGGISIAAGAGDYYNAFNALTQLPSRARVYMHGMNSYWYIPKNVMSD